MIPNITKLPLRAPNHFRNSHLREAKNCATKRRWRFEMQSWTHEASNVHHRFQSMNAHLKAAAPKARA